MTEEKMESKKPTKLRTLRKVIAYTCASLGGIALVFGVFIFALFALMPAPGPNRLPPPDFIWPAIEAIIGGVIVFVIGSLLIPYEELKQE